MFGAIEQGIREQEEATAKCQAESERLKPRMLRSSKANNPETKTRPTLDYPKHRVPHPELTIS